ncbi:MAG TPA: formylmethanofuran dehydrogenase subunit C [Gammaproteobacteria bacterium]|nr:formylmethanofuran dehydrogenase subunit C [Gammaproteobacteria bacterium]
MKPLKFTLKEAPRQRVGLSALIPDRLHGMRRTAIARIKLQCGNHKVTVGDLFSISGNDAQHLQLHGDLGKFDDIGMDMGSGSVTVRGRVGQRLGAAMRGGQIVVQGDAGDWLGANMHDGLIEVHGNTGNQVGGARPGEVHGMDGGTILVTGNAGMRVGDRMRRGMIILKGSAGDYCGARMLAGTILACGTSGDFVGSGMKRGTVILARRPERITATFNNCGVLKMQFLRLLFQHLTRTYPHLSELRGRGPLCERYCGDLATGGKGELMILSAAYSD